MIARYEYKGWTLTIDEITSMDLEDCYTEHFLENKDENVRDIVDWPARSEMSQTAFQLWIELGRPKRQGIGALCEEDLMRLALERITKA